MPSTFIFNQYYIDFLKRLKDEAKKDKSDVNGKNILKSIKDNYSTFDKNSDEYISYIRENISEEKWDSFVDNFDSWLKDNTEINLYKDISIGDIMSLLQDDYLCTHFVSVFYIFRNDLSDEVSASIVKILQTVDTSDLMLSIEDEKIRKVLVYLQEIRHKKIKDKSGIDMKFIEDTTIGKLAKEILEDVDVGRLQKAMGENGDVFKAIGDPDSGFADIITNVSKKMATKISNGELKQENLIQDALKFASSMPNMFGGAGKSGGKNGNGPDMASMMSMMSSMMGSGGGNDFASMFNGMAKQQKPKGTRTSVNESSLKKLAKAKQLKKKLQERKKASSSNAPTVSSDQDE